MKNPLVRSTENTFNVESQDFYEVLGVARDATQTEIRKAYRKASMKYHPDHNKDADASEVFQKIKKAYETLSNVMLREFYDNVGLPKPTREDLEAQAMDAANTVLCNVIDQAAQADEVELEYDDLMMAARNFVMQGRKQIVEERANLQKRISKMEQAIKRMRHKKKPFAETPIGNYTRDQVKALKQAYSMTEVSLEVNARTLEIVSEYSYETDERPIQQFPVRFSFKK